MSSSPLVRILCYCAGLCLLAVPVRAQAPVGDVMASDAKVKGSVVLSAASTRVMSGSSLSAGASNASVRLVRGGELRVCQGSSVSFATSPNGNAILVSMSSGTIEANYPLGNLRDSIMTPDFEIFLNGPGVFHVAVSADEHGNTCVQTQPGNTGSVTVSELMGDGSYTLRPDGQMVFRGGHAGNPQIASANCGCPPTVLVESASAERLKPVTNPVGSPPSPAATLMESPANSRVSAPLPLDNPGDIHVQVEAPFVFRASDPRRALNAPMSLAEVKIASLPAILPPDVQAPAAPGPSQQIAQDKPPKRKRHGLWGFLASIFKG